MPSTKLPKLGFGRTFIAPSTKRVAGGRRARCDGGARQPGVEARYVVEEEGPAGSNLAIHVGGFQAGTETGKIFLPERRGGCPEAKGSWLNSERRALGQGNGKVVDVARR